MKIAISGANGYIAKNLIEKLKMSGHQIVPIGRDKLYNIEELAVILSDTEIVINLAGAPILQRWTKKNKNEIIKSRIDTTQNIVTAINGLHENKKPQIFITASAIGIYSTNTIIHSELSTSFANDFIGEVVKNWENASLSLSQNVRRVVFRIGLVLGKDAQTIQKLLPVFKMGIGGKIGSGEQPFPFIHISDLVNAIFWAIQNEKARGIYNLSAPENIDNKTFTRVLAQLLKRPAVFTVPVFGLKLLYGEAASLLLQSPQVTPQRLLDEGFEFHFPEIKSCLAEITA